MSKRTCSIDGCDKGVKGRGWCSQHYTRWLRHGDPLIVEEWPATCSIEGCEGAHMSRGWCNMHYKRWKRNGEPTAVVQYQEKGLTAEEIIAARTERDGECIVWTGLIRSDYGTFKHQGKMLRSHRVAWEIAHGEIPEGFVVDHTCWNPKCVNVDHLRLASIAQNNANRSPRSIKSKTGVRNVRQLPSGRFEVRVKSGNKQIGFGTYATLGEAAAVAERARRELFGDYAGAGVRVTGGDDQ